MTDQQLRERFGLSERALKRLRLSFKFPPNDALINKTDSKLVDLFFDQRAGIASPIHDGLFTVDGKENWDDN